MKLRPLFLAFLLCLVGALTAYSEIFYQTYLSPKLLCLVLAAVAAGLLLVSARELRLPTPWECVFLALLAVEPILFAGGLVYLVVLNLNDDEERVLLSTISAVAVLQAPLALYQAATSSEVIGTVGNAEFLATLFGVTLLMGQRLPLAVLLTLGVLATRNKGAILFLAVFGLWKWKAARKPIVLAAIPMVLVFALLFPDSVKGRLLLWGATLLVGFQHPLGVGFGGLSSHLVDAYGDLFAKFPSMVGVFGPHSGMALDGHNLFLNSWAQFGIAGLIASAAFFRVAISRATPVLLFLLYKSAYTVVVGSVSGLLFFAIFLALEAPRREARSTGCVHAPVLLALLFVFVTSSRALTADAFYRRAMHESMLGEHAVADDYFEKTLERDPSHAGAWLGKALSRFYAEDKLAMDYYIRQALLSETDMDSLKTAAHLYYFRGMDTHARPLYERIHRGFPMHLTSLSRLAQIALRSGNVPLAGDYAEKVLAIYPRVPNESDERNKQIAQTIQETALRVESGGTP